MAGDVTLTVRSQLMKIVEELDSVKAKTKEVAEGMKGMGDEVASGLESNAKKTEGFFGKITSLGRRAADQLRGDFKSLLSLNAIAGSLKLSEQFRGAVQETITLSNSITKLGRVFGISRSEFSKLQTAVTKGLGEMGLSSEVASRTMQGLSQSGTRVAGQQSIIGYSQTAGQLASVTQQQGSEGDIAKSLAQVIQSRGGDVNDLKQLATVAEDVRRVFNATGQNATQTLDGMKSLFTGMSKDFRERISTRGLASLAATATVAGPKSTKFLEEFLSKSPIARQALEAQGFKGVFNDKGLDVAKFKAASQGVMGRVGGDPRLAAQTLGISEEAAEGFVRLAESLDKVKEAQDKIADSTGDLNTQYKESMGLGEAFKASINKVKGMVASPLSAATHGLTGVLSGASQSGGGAIATVGGAGILAAMLAGGGLRGVGKGLGGIAKGAAIEGATGREVQPVYVVNAKEIGGGGGVLDKAGDVVGAGGKLGKLGGIAKKGAGAFAAYEIGSLLGGAVNDHLISKTEGKTSEGFEGNVVEQLFFKLDKLLGGENSAKFAKQQKVMVELNTRDLKVSKQPTRGASH